MRSEIQSESESESEHEQKDIQHQFDFCSNEDLINRRNIQREKSKEAIVKSDVIVNEPQQQIKKSFERQNCPKDLTDLLQELVMEGNKIPTNISPIVNQILKEVQLIAPIYEHLSYQKSEKNFQDYPYEEENDFDLDEQKEQLENFKNSDEANSHSTDDAQESINSNKTSGQVSSPSTKPKIQLQGATKLVYQSDCGGDTKYMEEALTTHSGTAHSVNGAANILDINYKNDPLATNLSPAITYKKKEYQNQTSKKKDVDSKQAIEEEQSKFVIIRSSKSFVPEQTHNNNNNQNKKRKKKRSKAVGPSQTASKDEQSSKLNAFMRSIVSTVPEEQIVQKEISETQIFEPVIQTQQPAVIKKTESKKTVKTSQQPVYVKKAVHESLIPPVAKSEKIDDTNSKSFIQNSATKFSNFLKNEDSKQNQHNNSSQFQPKTHASQKLSSHDEFEEKSVNAHTKRFDHFINEKESFQYGGLRGGDNMGNSERPRKKDNKQQQHKKSANWGNPNNRNGKKNAQSPQDGLLKRNSYHSNNNTHVMKKDQSQSSNLSNQYLSTPVTRHHSVNEGQYDQGIGMNIDYNQQYDMYQQIDQSNIPFISIEQIQSLITNAAAMMQSQQQYIKQHAEAQMAFDNAENRIHNYNNMDQVDTQELEEMFFDKLEVQIKSLEKEIERKLDSVRKERQLAITTLEEIIKKTYNENSHQNSLNHKNFVGIRMYGSMASGLAIDSSDVDLAVTGLDFHGNRESHLKEMRELYHQLSFIKSKSSIKFVDSATVPVIKLIIDLQKIHEQTAKNGKKSLGASLKTSNESSLQSNHEIDPSMRYLGIDITFEDSQGSLNDQFGNFSQSLNGNIQPSKINLGIQCISHIQTLRMEFPDLKPIVMVLKRLLQLKDLNQPYHGGISSYSLVLMTSTFLNQCGTDQMGSNLSEFLNYYGNFFDPQNTQLDGKSFSTRFSGNTLDPMVVIDPLNPSNNTTRSSFRISEIQYVFKRAHNVIYQKLEEFKKSSENSQEFDVIRYIVDNQDNILM